MTATAELVARMSLSGSASIRRRSAIWPTSRSFLSDSALFLEAAWMAWSAGQTDFLGSEDRTVTGETGQVSVSNVGLYRRYGDWPFSCLAECEGASL